MRIVADDTWEAVKARQKQIRQAMKSASGICGAGFIMAAKNRLGCFGARDQEQCDNHLTIRRDEIEARVLSALQDRPLRQELFEEFCDEFMREITRLHMEQRASPSAAKREIQRIEVRRKKLVAMVMDGVSP